MSADQTPDCPAIVLDKLTKSFDDFQLGPLDLTLDPGTVLALVGPNGAGKTTTLNCMAGLVVPDSGEARILGVAVHPNRPESRRSLGYVGEESGFFQRWTARRNLEFLAGFLPDWSAVRAQTLVERFGLPLDKTVSKLSRGNRTKLSLVAALAHSPRVLLLDEPTAGLDPVVRAEVLDVLWEITEDGDHAVLYSTHILSDISRLADEVAFLRNGHIVLRSEREELSERWRRISFRLSGFDCELVGVVEHRSARAGHQVITKDATATLEQLAGLGAEAIEVARMSIDEIAVEILKEEHDVARTAS